MTIPDPEAAQQEERIPRYYISFERLNELNRSAVILLAARRTPMSPSLLREDHELDDPQELLNEIAEFCGDEEDFIHSNMPVQEIVFRTLLTRRNEPMSLTDLHQDLTEKWATPVRPIHVSLKNLGRILESDDYYGFARVVEE